MPVHVYQYPKCSTCRKALAWLDAHGIEYTKTDLVLDPPSAAKLAELHRRSGLPIARFFNTSGESYRAGGFKDRLPAMALRDALGALANDGKLVKRPIVELTASDDSHGKDGGAVLVGFDEKAFASHFKTQPPVRRPAR